MRKLVVAVIAIVVATIAFIAFTGFLNLAVKVGFTADDLVTPNSTTITRSVGHAPYPATDVRQMANWGVTWEIPEDGVYSGFGGILWLSLNNYDNRDIWVYKMSLTWTGTNATYSKETGILAVGGEEALVGILPFGAPLDPGPHPYEIRLSVAVQSATGYWYDWGNLLAADNNYLDVQSTPVSAGWNTDLNPISYYDKVNERVSVSAVNSVITHIHESYSGDYDVLQICEAYEWVRANVQYVGEAGDYWQSAKETMSAMSGDCEDHAILMASIIKGLGGNARVNVINGHAFPTVFVAQNESGLAVAEVSVNSYYWTPSGSLRINYLIDDLGYWMVIDTTGEPYVGGLPALCSYASPGPWPGAWTFSDSDFLITIDATGTSSSPFNVF